MTYRRGFFRLWLVATAVALIGAPIWLLSAGMRQADHTCFKITEFQLKDPQSVLAALQLPITICTEPALTDDIKTQALERNWADIESLKVDYGHRAHDVENFVPTGKRDFDALYARADLRYQNAVFFDLLKHQVPVLEGLVIVLAVAVWWVGRLVAVIALWIRHGFAG